PAELFMRDTTSAAAHGFHSGKTPEAPRDEPGNHRSHRPGLLLADADVADPGGAGALAAVVPVDAAVEAAVGAGVAGARADGLAVHVELDGAAAAVGGVDAEVVPLHGLDLLAGLAAAAAAVDLGGDAPAGVEQQHPQRAAVADDLGEVSAPVGVVGHEAEGHADGLALLDGVAHGARQPAAGLGAARGPEVVAGLVHDLHHLPALLGGIVGDLDAVLGQAVGRAGEPGHRAVLEVAGEDDGPLGVGALPRRAGAGHAACPRRGGVHRRPAAASVHLRRTAGAAAARGAAGAGSGAAGPLAAGPRGLAARAAAAATAGLGAVAALAAGASGPADRKSTRLNSSHQIIS